jgi:hypothetical protein
MTEKSKIKELENSIKKERSLHKKIVKEYEKLLKERKYTIQDMGKAFLEGAWTTEKLPKDFVGNGKGWNEYVLKNQKNWLKKLTNKNK